jgi:chorismate-pyruvate lyase
MPYTARSSTQWPRRQRGPFAAKDRSFEKTLSGRPALDGTPDHRWRALVMLSERISRAKSATEELELWCQQNRIGNGRIVAIAGNDVDSHTLDDDSLEALGHPESRHVVRFRRVRLATAGTVVVDALNWYFPSNLTPDMNVQLLTTNIPFGHVVAPLHAWRSTFFVRRCTPGQFAELRSAGNCRFVFEHRAVVRAADGAPLAVVHERFLKTLLGAAA